MASGRWGERGRSWRKVAVGIGGEVVTMIERHGHGWTRSAVRTRIRDWGKGTDLVIGLDIRVKEDLWCRRSRSTECECGKTKIDCISRRIRVYRWWGGWSGLAVGHDFPCDIDNGHFGIARDNSGGHGGRRGI
jgi:hypothetical protein